MVLFYAALIPNAAACGKKYGRGSTSLNLQAMTSRKELYFNQIESIAKLDADEGADLLNDSTYLNFQVSGVDLQNGIYALLTERNVD